MSYVYFMRPVGAAGPVKIGCSSLPQTRLKQLSLWSPEVLEIAVMIPGSFELERNIHQCFGSLYMHHEWFREDPRITALIEKLQAGTPIAEAIDLSAREPIPRKSYARWQADPKVRLRMSYSQRLSHAERRLGSAEVYYHAPADALQIMERWRGRNGHVATSPTEAELARLEQVLADPSCFVPHYRPPHIVAEILARAAA